MLPVASSLASGRPAQSSSAVKRAMDSAASTEARSAAGEKSELLAWPRRWPMYTDTPSPLSRLYSMVSTACRRTVTDWPKPSETSTSQAVAPLLAA